MGLKEVKGGLFYTYRALFATPKSQFMSKKLFGIGPFGPPLTPSSPSPAPQPLKTPTPQPQTITKPYLAILSHMGPQKSLL